MSFAHFVERIGKNSQKVVFTLSTKNQCARGCAWVLDVFLGGNYLNCRHIQNPERHFGVEARYRDFSVSTTYWQKLAERPYKCQLHSSFWAKKIKNVEFCQILACWVFRRLESVAFSPKSVIFLAL